MSAIGISPADVYVNFVPNYEYVIDYSVTGYRAFEFYTEGEFSEYTWVEELHHTETQGNFRVHLVLPEEYETPGKHKMYVAAREKPLSGTVNTVAVIRGFVEVDVPFPGYYATMEVTANDVNEGEPVTVTTNVYNKGKLNISNARLRLVISSGNANLLTFESEAFSIETTGGYTFQKTISGGQLKPGSYNATAYLFYEGQPKQKSAVFRVGTFDVNIVNYTREMFNNTVNLFGIEIESLWNNPLSTVWMDLSIKNGSRVLSTIKTPPFDLAPWEKRKSEVYWNTAGIDVGEYDLEIVLHYSSGTRTENRKIYIVDKPQMVQEKPIPIATILLVCIALILIIFNIFFILRRRKDDDEDKKKKEKGK
ncbi:hypothetical protein KY363_02480 [Candidatus Woesearchaeota archaeon]|nr:hypothetical protein [Candidatus Woesearchaeota archaeon]